ncbi:MAG: hypothetical protein E7578_01630 [Ruminococcaceae bacterium]|nr:hypothetical protein [Oscillospiraceae bacterium]
MIYCTTKRVFSVLLTLIIVFSVFTALLPQNSFAEAPTSKSISGGIVPERFYPSKEFISDIKRWEVADKNVSSVTSVDGEDLLRISSENSSVDGKLVYNETYNCSSYKEAGIYLRPIGDTEYTITLTVQHSNGKSSYSETVSSGEEYYIFTALPSNTTYISSISFNARLTDTDKDESKAKASVILKGASLSKTDHSDIINRYSAFNITGIDNSSAVDAGSRVTAGPIITDISGETVAIRVFLDGDLGGVTLNYAEDGENYSVYGSSVITDGRSCYIFTIDRLISGAFYSIEFTGIKDNSVTVSAVDFIPTESVRSSVAPCTVSKNFYNAENETLNITGSIARDTVIKYIDKSLCLFEFSMWQTSFDTILATDPIDTADMSTSFSFSVPVSKDRFPFCVYIIAINDDGNVQPLSDPIYPHVGTGHVGISLTNSLYGKTPEAAVISGYDNYITDIDLSSLFLEGSSNNSSVFTHDNFPFYINKDTTSELTKKVRFLNDAGVGTIFNITLDSDFSPKNESDCRTLAAVISYLHGEYSPFGFIISGITGSLDGKTISTYAQNKALILRLSYAASEGNSVIYTDIDASKEGETLAWFLSGFTKSFSVANLEFILTGISSTHQLDAVADSAADGGYSYGFTVMAEHGNNIIAPVSGSTHISRSVSYIHHLTDDDDIPTIQNTWGNYKSTVSAEYDTDNSIILWDFTKSYDTGRLTISPLSDGIFTVTNYALEDFTGISSCRSVKTTLDLSSPVLIAKPEAPMMLTDAPTVSFLVQCNSNSSFTLEFIFMSGKDRAVFSAEYSGSGIYIPSCDLSVTNIHHKIDRIAIVLSEGNDVELNIATISATGSGSVKDAESTVYLTQADNTTENPVDGAYDTPKSSTVIYAVIGSVILVTIIIFAVLSIRKS